MHKFTRNLITEWRRLDLPFTGETLVVAVSGGADSVALLLALCDLTKRKKLGHRIVAAHFDHGLRLAASEADADFVRKLTKKIGVDSVIKKGSVAKRGNLEQNARDARYAFLIDTAIRENAFAVLTGHTMNDQAETFLLNLIRGSGADGLSAMPAVRPLERETSPDTDQLGVTETQISLIRPLLRWAKRAETESYCSDLGADFRHDAMNDDLAFKRVRVRKELIPLLEQMNPKVVEALARTANIMSAAVADQTIDSNELGVSELRKLDEMSRRTVVRGWIKAKLGTLRRITSEHILAVERLTLSTKSGRIVELPDGKCVRRNGGKLKFDHLP